MTDTQLDIFTHVRATDPSTSRRAAESVNVSKSCRRLLAALHANRMTTFTDGELAALVIDDRSIVARRRKDMEEAGLVEGVIASEHGEQLERLGLRGRFELVWCLTPEGAEKARTA